MLNDPKLFPGSGVVPDRQDKAYAHGAFVYKNFVYVADLGADKIWHFKVTIL